MFGLVLVAVAMVFGAGAWLVVTLRIRQDAWRQGRSADEQAMAWIADPRLLGRTLSKLDGHGTLFQGLQPLGLLFSVNAVAMNHWYGRVFAAHPQLPWRLARIAQLSTRQS